MRYSRDVLLYSLYLLKAHYSWNIEIIGLHCVPVISDEPRAMSFNMTLNVIVLTKIFLYM